MNMTNGDITDSEKPARFTFDRHFDTGQDHAEHGDEAVEELAPPPPPPPMFDEATLQAARDEARTQGRSEGLNAGKTEAEEGMEAQIAASLETIAGTLDGAIGADTRTRDEVEAMAARILRAIVERLLPSLVARHGADEIIALVRNCMTPMYDQDRLSVHIAPEQAEALRPRLMDMATGRGFADRLQLLEDPELAAGDVRVEWGGGGAARCYDDIWAEISAAVDRALETAAPAGDKDKGEGEGEDEGEGEGEDASKRDAAAPDGVPDGADAQNMPEPHDAHDTQNAQDPENTEDMQDMQDTADNDGGNAAAHDGGHEDEDDRPAAMPATG